MKKAFFSIIIPIYKVREEYMRECMGSILRQTFGDFELILVDDGSPDNCGRICDEYAASDKRVHVIHQENQGVSVARNNGLKIATADWVIFVDGDDWIEPDTCEILYNRLSHQDCDLLMFCACRDNNGKIDRGIEHRDVYDLNIPSVREYVYRRVMGVSVEQKSYSPVYYVWDKVYKRSFLEKNGIEFPVGLGKSEDKIFNCYCFEKLSVIYRIDNLLYHYRTNEESVCHRYSQNMDRARVDLAKLLQTIAIRMDGELAVLLNDPSYHKISDDCTRFIFGVITDVLCLKFYHKDNPNRRGRRKAALECLRSEPFRSVIRNIPYSSLSKFSKMKKFMLMHGWVSTFCNINTLLRRF